MKLELQEFDENSSYFFSTIANKEGDKRLLPGRALRKTYSEFYDEYINEALIGIEKTSLPGNKEGYDNFNNSIESILNKKSIKDKLNIITFFGDKNVDLSELLSFEDINLLADFEQRYNDHFVSMPFTLKFREPTYGSAQIFEDIKASYQNFVSTLKTQNILGYVPAYVSHRDLDKFVKFYLDNNQSIKSPEGKLNYVPLLIDCKNSLPDSNKRSLAKLRQLKAQYLKEGYYLFYYGFSLGTPRVSMKTPNALSREFLLAFLGFDVMGGSHARFKGGGGSDTLDKRAGRFDSSDFNYHLKTVPSSVYKRVKPQNFTEQTRYLNTLSSAMKKDREIVTKELVKRSAAHDYIETYR